MEKIMTSLIKKLDEGDEDEESDGSVTRSLGDGSIIRQGKKKQNQNQAKESYATSVRRSDANREKADRKREERNSNLRQLLRETEIQQDNIASPSQLAPPTSTTQQQSTTASLRPHQRSSKHRHNSHRHDEGYRGSSESVGGERIASAEQGTSEDD
ncbi:MAG: hypothetical protein EZS28_053585 [Streblomastix strix]|uniref:Uncharacterized protein n=1 Tax=Streblomastix strix TaxID=222440 RepID=A0A5J4R8I6_9EUKA|nr:MAG: hypothetical protein EZS28_053585 [Streblomastix strix]